MSRGARVASPSGSSKGGSIAFPSGGAHLEPFGSTVVPLSSDAHTGGRRTYTVVRPASFVGGHADARRTVESVFDRQRRRAWWFRIPGGPEPGVPGAGIGRRFAARLLDVSLDFLPVSLLQLTAVVVIAATIATDEQHRGRHDRLAGTIVMSRPDRRRLRPTSRCPS